MIRSSTLVATAAVVLSLLAHVFGLVSTMRVQPERAREETATEVVALDNTFEDLAETLSEPNAPEPAPIPEPPSETLPEPDRAEIPTSKALVASPDPQTTRSPGTGQSTSVQAETVNPIVPAQGAVVEPEILEAQPASDGAVADSAATPESTRDASIEPVDTATAQPLLEPSIDSAQTPDAAPRLAALPVQLAPTLPVTPVSEPPTVPGISSNQEPVDPTSPDRIVAAVPEGQESEAVENEFGGSNLAVKSSPRPSSRLPRSTPRGQIDSELPPLELMESPLIAYARDGNLDGWLGHQGSGSSGNSGVTNYAGRVLVHLNNAPRVRAQIRGSARVVLEINPDGTLARVDVIESTGTFELDSAAKAQVRNAAPFPPPPQGATRKLSFVYRSK